ncbi:hypothetical protein FOMG_19577 [Fusarium oxysporum f. sp. melonis 26406]|uniref:Uncharacterized protein n=2 Tax=Fusarium oxysporum TaxID=5507 RepID=A0A2H3G9G5_FUSOX|nr:hypothetical protein FOMG_19577 [Fusarium oxysporum f. sp. melonis 26406]PCD22273.1 hypothetical protein AU210_016063 [Fusarium oxysporum f. sp. radicis-cucumerinum]
MQRCGIPYIEDRLWSIVPHGRKETTTDINLKGAWSTLIRWLCTILGPAIGWQARDHGHSPLWTTAFKTDIALVIEASDMAADFCSPPSSIEAMKLLIEPCWLFGLGIDPTRLTNFEPYKASFLAALALPFYNFMELQPQLPYSRLAKPQNNSAFSSPP